MTALASCPICGCRSGNATRVATEGMFGLGEQFTYLECAACGTLSLLDAPSSAADFYPAGYHSFGHPAGGGRGAGAQVSALVANRFLRSRPTGLLARAARATQALPPWIALLAGRGLTTDAAVLDVGCGNGHRLRALQRAGMTKLFGVDPFAPPELELGPGIQRLVRPLERIDGQYGVVMFHHSFEHLADPAGALSAVRRLLSPNGVVVLRLPLADSFAWRRYGSHWAQLDAPRHVHVFTRRALHLVAHACGFVVAATAHDSTAFQFWASEQYRRGIPLVDPRSYHVDPAGSMFAPQDIRRYERRARRLNAIGDGDQAAFILIAA